MKRLLLKVFMFFLFGVVIYHSHNLYIAGAAIAALFLIGFIKKNRYLFLYCLIFLFLGVLTSHVHKTAFEKKYLYISSKDSFEGFIMDKYDGGYVILNKKEGYKIRLSSYNNSSLLPGYYIYFDASVSTIPDYKKIRMFSTGINAYASTYKSEIKYEKRKSIYTLPSKIKYKINDGLISVNKEGGSFVSGLISGYKNGNDYDDKKIFNDLGISHILAVSGFNIGIIYLFLSVITKKLKKRLRYLIILLTCFLYTAIGGFEPSITRAFLMISISIIANILNRSYDTLNGIILSAFIMLLINSYYIYNIGFILSFLATLGIILFNDDIKEKLPKWTNKIKDEVCVSLAAFIVTFPVVIWYRGTFSLVSILINIAIGPLISIITVLGFITSLIFLLTGILYVLYPVVFLGDIFIKLTRVVSRMNILFCTGRPGVIFLVLYYFLILFYFGYIKINIIKKSKKYINAVILIMLIFFLFYKEPTLKIHFIDVGQGESIFIQTPRRHNILIDTGPEFSGYSAARDKVIPYLRLNGCDNIDLLIITHYHLDHAGGLKYIFDELKIKKYASFSNPKEYNAPFEKIMGGNLIRVDGIEINVLYPTVLEEIKDDKNENCVVMELKYKDFSMLLTADAEMEVMDCISGEFDVFKVPHHGSIHSQSIKMLDNSKIGTAVISVGKNNFGHPSMEVIGELEKRFIDVIRTDEKGSITIITDGRKYRVLSESQ